MLNLIHAAEDPSPTHQYAHACWQQNPRIAASWWREAQGLTVSKIALNWQTEINQPHLLGQGVNLVLTGPHTHAAAARVIAASGVAPGAVVTVCITPHPQAALALNPAPSVIVWSVPANVSEEEQQQQLTALETAVKQGQLTAYGLADADLPAIDTPRPLHNWLEAAGTAAATAWGRRKRPALRFLVAEVDLLNFSWLTTANTWHGGEDVSPLELAARLGLTVIGTPGAWPHSGQPPLAALQALTAVANAENELNQSLGGWPHVGEEPLFSVLESLARGRAPWPHPAAWGAWQRHQLPWLAQQWQAQPEAPQAMVEAYFSALAALLPHGPALAQAAAQPALQAVLEQLSPSFPKAYQGQAAAIQAAGLLSSVPGLTSLGLAGVDGLQTLQSLGDFPDVGFLFAKPTKPA